MAGILDILNSGDLSGLMGLFKKPSASPSSPPPARGEAPPTPDNSKYAKLATSGLQSLAAPPTGAPRAEVIPGRQVQMARPAYGVPTMGLQSLATPIGMAKGGIAGKGGGHNDKTITSAAVAALQGQHPAPQIALGQYLKRFGQSALRDLVDKVHTGTPMQQAGQITGPGDGMSDNVPAQGPGGSDVLLADGEYVVPADVVSGLGNGSTDAGVRKLKDMEASVRQSRTGTKTQPAPLDPQKVLPA